MCAAGSVDCLQADATRCGGYTEWLRAAAVAASFELDVSAHCAPNLHAPVAAAVPNLRHIEWFHDHVRIEQLLLRGALDPQGGCVVRIVLADDVLTATVRDGGVAGVVPSPPAGDPLRVHGRGLQVVEALSSRWGYDFDGEGASVWFTLDLA